jgi:hypothetical protein
MAMSIGGVWSQREGSRDLARTSMVPWWRSLSARRDPDSRYDAHQTASCYSGRRPAKVAIYFAAYTGVSFEPRRAAIPVFSSSILFAPCERPDEWEKI